jgi:hypothetical protein
MNGKASDEKLGRNFHIPMANFSMRKFLYQAADNG